ncbi:MAG: hypothetical protein U1E02_25215 [Hydrogenophaga sp.]|nr:hypothetical protein [Hydrogenophaga sp.]MDZ4127435.1 hypothetical protein [Hydrogenophaga sp.]
MTDEFDTVTPELPELEPRWRVLLREAIAAHGRGGVTRAATAMGVSRVYVARVFMTGKNRIEVPSKRFIAAALEAFGHGRVDCPHLGHDISGGECRRYAALTWAVIQGTGPEKVLHWRACQACPHNPQPESAKAPPKAPKKPKKAPKATPATPPQPTEEARHDDSSSSQPAAV